MINVSQFSNILNIPTGLFLQKAPNILILSFTIVLSLKNMWHILGTNEKDLLIKKLVTP